MGILGYPNMDENNHDGGFGDYSDIYANFADEENSVSSDESYSDSMNTSLDEQSVSQAGIPDNTQSEYNDFQNNTTVRQNDNGRLFIYLVVLALVLISAAGMFFYKKHMAASENVVSEQEMGDYFYDKAAGTTPENPAEAAKPAETPQQNAETQMATVDVDLSADTPAAAVAPKKAKAKTKEKAASEEKPMTALEKAMAKKKADEQKENRISLGNSVVIPVTSGGRSDPFLPYGIASAGSAKPKFDLIAPPLVIPETDPMTDKMLEFKLSGIMFDDVRPSAILSIDGTEQLVHKGDVVMGYRIINITRKSVLVKYGTNTYEVTTGQTINSEEKLNLNPVSSLSKQFGGAYTKSPENVIQFNN